MKAHVQKMSTSLKQMKLGISQYTIPYQVTPLYYFCIKISPYLQSWPKVLALTQNLNGNPQVVITFEQ